MWMPYWDRHTCMCDIPLTWLICVCDMMSHMWYMTYPYVWHHSLIYVTWHTCNMTNSYVWYDSFIRVTWLVHTCDMTHSYMWHDSFLCETARSHVWHDSFTCVTCLPYMFAHDSSAYVASLVHTCETQDIHMCNVTQSKDAFIYVTWLTRDVTHSYVAKDSFTWSNLAGDREGGGERRGGQGEDQEN